MILSQKESGTTLREIIAKPSAGFYSGFQEYNNKALSIFAFTRFYLRALPIETELCGG